MLQTGTGLCRHFGVCGGCSLQNLTRGEYLARKKSALESAFLRQGLGQIELLPIIEIAPGTRRRATFKARKDGGQVVLGFNQARLHEIVDLQECLVVEPALFALGQASRELLPELLQNREQVELSVTLTDTGADVDLRRVRKTDPGGLQTLSRWAARHRISRVTLNGAVAVLLAQPVLHFGRIAVTPPPGAFLQPTCAGERALQDRVTDALRGARAVLDLFAGCGTFSLPLAERSCVHAVELEGGALEALKAAARAAQRLKPLTVERRDLFRVPLSGPELARFDAVLLDPPRAGAAAQVAALGRSAVRSLVYVSCNPESFARDARILLDSGFQMSPVTQVDQFLWSSHIELVANFRRP